MVTFSGTFAQAQLAYETKKTDDIVAFIGLQYRFGGEAGPELVVGVRNTYSNDTSKVYGSKVDLAFPIDSKKWQTPTIRVLGVYGGCNVQGEAGLGYSFGQKSLFVSLGGQAPYANAGLNYNFNSSAIGAFAGINSLAAPGCAEEISLSPSPPPP